MGKEKMKIAMICHFSNKEVREHLPFGKRRVYKIIKRLAGQAVDVDKHGDLAVWDTYIINSLKDRDDVELHVISACNGLKKRLCRFQLDNVHYYFFDASLSTFLKHVFFVPQVWHFFNPTRPLVQKLVKEINPDLVALVGAENPHYSDAILGLKGYPIIVKGQTVYNNPNRKRMSGGWNRINAYVERRIFKENRYFSFSTEMHYELFCKFNKNAYNLRWRWCATYPEIETNVHKDYDFVNFARQMAPSKGFQDSIKALAIVKQTYPEVTLNLEGEYSDSTYNELYSLAKEHGVENNIVFTQFLANQEDVYKNIIKSRFAVLPCKLDYIPSTIVQAMHFGIPVVCYETLGTPNLNKDGQRVLIAEMGNVNDLASKMIELMSNAELSSILSEESRKYVKERNNQAAIAEEMIASFKAVIGHFRKGSPIDTRQLYIFN